MSSSLSSLKKNFKLKNSIVAILDRVTPPLNDFENDILSYFDDVIGLGASCNDLDQINNNLFI